MQFMYRFFVLCIRWLGNREILDVFALILFGQMYMTYFVYFR